MNVTLVIVAIASLFCGIVLTIVISPQIMRLHVLGMTCVHSVTERMVHLCLWGARAAWKGAVILDWKTQTFLVHGIWSPHGSSAPCITPSFQDGDTEEYKEGFRMQTRILSPDKKYAVVLDDGSQTVQLVDLEHYVTICSYRSYVVTAVSWSPDSTGVAIGSPYRTVHVWSAATGELVAARIGSSEAHKGLCRVVHLMWSPDGKMIASACTDGKILVWDTRSGTISESHLHHSQVIGMCWSPEGERLASASLDGVVAIWRLESGEAVAKWECPVQVQHLKWETSSTLLIESAGMGIAHLKSREHL